MSPDMAQAGDLLNRRVFLSGFRKPVHILFPPGSARSAYVVEQGGRIYRVSQGKRSLFLDISRKVNGGYEGGLLSLAFPPTYQENKGGATTQAVFYINFTAGRPSKTIIAEVPFKTGKTYRAFYSRKRIVLKIKQPYSNHNGGHILFGPDRMLYIGMGDGGAGGDPLGKGQKKNTLLGKILRIDPRRSGRKAYRIPRNNPFRNRAAFRPEIYAWGLRNPWRMSFDRKNGRLFVADVGQSSREEINIVQSGDNLGWNIMEGKLCFRPRKNCRKTGLVQPIHQYGRNLGGSVTGGYVYRGKVLKSYVGHYFFADYITGRVWALPLTSQGQAKGPARAAFRNAGNISSFGEDTAGELYLVEHSGGKIYKISP